MASKGNRGSRQFIKTKEVSLRSPWELKFVRYILSWKISENRSNDEVVRCLMVFQHELCGQ